ncbi:GIY-YIG nuclease family protein [Pseudanabaenaceae cyanobacterium LEGE 13415]|nr:GIY-YIG nuclease family protein [Pseudanabaenaceae cyanobacterium LEGE 13415]
MNEIVYLLQQVNNNGVPTGFYRIAKTVNDVETRVKRLETEHATRLVPIYKWSTNDAQSAKSQLYKYFERFKCKGLGSHEWLDFRNVSLDWILSEVKDCFNIQPPQQSTYSSSSHNRYQEPSFDFSELPWGWMIGGFLALVAIGANASSQNMTESRPGEDQKVQSSEIRNYGLALRAISNGRNPSSIRQYFHEIANDTQATCTKNFANEMKDSAGVNADLKTSLKDLRQKYAGCKPLQVMENRNGYFRLRPN